MRRTLALLFVLLSGCGAKREPVAPVEPTEPTPTPITGPKKEVFRDGDVVINEIGPDTYEVIAPGEKAGVDSEYMFLDTLRCGGGEGRWKVKSQALTDEKGRAYDKLDAVCTAGGETKTFTFDITSFFGKL
jgi:hypothetical protein